MTQADPVARAIHALVERRSLSEQHAHEAFTQVMAGESSMVQMSAFLVALRFNGETVDEVVGAVRALREAMVKVPAGGAVDTCGTGGGAVGTFNISTAAALVVAGAGARVAKHGNRSFTSRSGSADVLEALGVPIPQNAGEASAALERAGMAFLFAPLFHPAMKHVGPVRRELGLSTVMNILGPLANPAGVRRQVVGVADAARAPLIAEALGRLGADHALVVNARCGMDEISPVGPSDVWEVKGGDVRQWSLEPERFRLASGNLADLAGGEPRANAEITERILDGSDRGIRRSAVVINAAAALVASGTAVSWEEAATRAGAALDDGSAGGVLGKLRQGT